MTANFWEGYEPEPVQDTEAHYKGVVEGVQKLFDDKRAQPAPVQEPMETYIHHCRYQPHPNDFGIPKGHWWQAKQYADAVNTTPPAAQRQWVGLTDEEIKEVNAKVSQIPPIDYTTTTYARAIEAKLKEKNT
jgi:hypothetical protein